MTEKRQELKERLLRAFEICDKHVVRIEEALRGLKLYFPLDEETYLNLNSDAVMRLDQFIFRFSKLQDAIGTKIFRYVLSWLYEEVETMSMRDVLDRLERLGVIDSIENWVYMRELRNTIAHDYPLDTQEVVVSLNELVESTGSLKIVYERLKERFFA
ncbi:toxin-antitoxin system antitoxin subunit [Odoribacter lunatus]|uniref:toxin-antitoxin system antitoxin subunit n=1 Tax=Odoribacter lunatus TaxID=2941335 RepID=UPI00203CD31E|nr:toxin-antitoxin system antitoxin subunit [Odoribacter lunatus]